MARTLRGLGVATPPDASVAYAAALAEVGVARRSSAYWAGRATLVRRPEDIPAYDRAFAAVFEGILPGSTTSRARRAGVGDRARRHRRRARARSRRPRRRRAHPHPAVERQGGAAHEGLRRSAPSPSSTRPTASWPTCGWCGARRPSRRYRPTRRHRGPLDLGATTRRALHTGGEPMDSVHRRAGDRPRRIVLLCDVSGSMEAYARALVRFAHVAVAGRAQVEVFTLGTRCTRITRELRSHDPDAALDAVAGVVDDWSGGTRLGEGLRTFNDTWGAARPGPRRGGGDPVRRVGPRRPRGARRAGPPAAAASPTGSCGSTRSRPAPASSRWPAAWPPRCPTSTSWSRATPSRRSTALAEVIAR